ncbi:hypothetical protein E4656_11755 [Natronospirillum operosum]|uniref:Stress response protein n=1 Tax=Natronospirillum operosum TaxID=2759953 RepID=A0A4Z0WDI7_9GAMM|nr:hypothetical protein [Natronospirillum operosum]TGG92799.1 hypothetical protein E4656_11755 [Natronospirillum operosum]
MDRPDYIIRGEPARLIPVVADSGKESKATSVFLAAMRGVKEFREVMLGSLGLKLGSRAQLEAWTEVVFKDDKEAVRNDRPDGLIVVSTGRKDWSALIESKIRNNEIEEEQLKHYLKRAKANGMDAVITITNQFVAMPSHHPIKLPKNLLKNIDLYHWSWMFIVTQATLLLDSGEFESDDQKFLLEEVVRFLGHDASGITRFDSMNKEWKDLVGKIKSDGQLNKSSEEVENTVSSWHQEQRDLCLVMSRQLGQPVRLKLSRTHRLDPVQRLKDDAEQLAKSKHLNCCLEVPNAASDIEVTADLAKRTITCLMRLTAPRDKKRTSARINWLARQLSKSETEGIYVRALRPGRAEETQATLAQVLESADALDSGTTDVVPSTFEVYYLVDLAGRFAGSKKFIEELEKAVPTFYEQVGERLRAWVPPPPKLQNKKDPVGNEDWEDGESENGDESM